VKGAYVVACSLVLLMAFLRAPAVQASCASAVVVDGSVLFGYEAADWKLPSSDGRVRAVAPACNDAGQARPDGETTVVRFKGIPPDIAVRSESGDQVFLASGSLTALAAHPLHRPSRRFARRGCTRQPKLEGAAGAAGFDSITLVSGGRTHFVRVDAHTTLVNRPAYQPIARGQGLQIAGKRCGTRLVADRIAFTGPTVVPEPYRPSPTRSLVRSFPWGLAFLIGAGCVAFVAMVIRITRPPVERSG
jgi:hypothetical protein